MLAVEKFIDKGNTVASWQHYKSAFRHFTICGCHGHCAMAEQS